MNHKVKKPRLEERETIITYNERYPLADIFTYNHKLQKRLLRFSGLYPEYCRRVRTEPEGSMTFYLDKKRLSIVFMAPYTEEKRKRYAELGRRSSFMQRIRNTKDR